MITHTIDSYQIQSQNKTKSKLQIRKNLTKIQILEFCKKKTLHVAHLLKLIIKMCKYEMDLPSNVEVTEQTRFCPQTDG